jgi:hypothetical protein
VNLKIFFAVAVFASYSRWFPVEQNAAKTQIASNLIVFIIIKFLVNQAII